MKTHVVVLKSGQKIAINEEQLEEILISMSAQETFFGKVQSGLKMITCKNTIYNLYLDLTEIAAIEPNNE